MNKHILLNDEILINDLGIQTALHTELEKLVFGFTIDYNFYNDTSVNTIVADLYEYLNQSYIDITHLIEDFKANPTNITMALVGVSRIFNITWTGVGRPPMSFDIGHTLASTILHFFKTHATKLPEGYLIN